MIETRPGKAVLVAERVSHIEGFRLFGGDGRHLVSGLWRVPEGNTLEGMCEALQALNPEILRVYPTFIIDEDR